MTNFPHVATNSFAPTPQNSYIQQQQAFMTGLQLQLDRDEITGTVVKSEEQEIQELCAEVEEEEEKTEGIGPVSLLAVLAAVGIFAGKHLAVFIITLLTYVDKEIAGNFLSAK